MKKNNLPILNKFLLSRDFDLDAIKVDDFKHRLNYLSDKKKRMLVDELINSSRDDIYCAFSTTFVFQTVPYYKKEIGVHYFERVVTLLDTFAGNLQSTIYRLENTEYYTDMPSLSKSELENIVIDAKQFFGMSNQEKDIFLKESLKIFSKKINKFHRNYILLKNIEFNKSTSNSLKSSIDYNTEDLIRDMKVFAKKLSWLAEDLKKIG
ncbi:hypothetical protein [Streptococcus jiangjianxini]|uniref:hypothetical protein n=1 Tax=Streptococcus jiangjianxini TaxID=3161189 RepID=UPI0032ED0BC4